MDTYPHQYEPLFTMSTDYYTPLIGDNMMLFNQQQEKLAEPQQYPQQQQQQLKEEQNDTQAHDSSKKKAKRKQVKNACVNCQKACKKCDNGRPCQRCIKLGLTATCVDSPRKERRKGIKRGPYKKRQTSQSPSSTSTTQTSGMPPRSDVLFPSFFVDRRSLFPSDGSARAIFPSSANNHAGRGNSALLLSCESRKFELVLSLLLFLVPFALLLVVSVLPLLDGRC
ncbi:hypothetical protein BCR43DRAFT_347634 [Syncephalastrum racemosum]|uniref:Zn(2)-C6 fungal-type domain-containing protein n=1 Tax=Syncephalastrum racemosum TaxID=13706 RepID=A0A1X2H5T9_SYNRA|nr:hypothetical protein BCR43DRAFT_347634 [Syncephalastrum racemosum]